MRSTSYCVVAPMLLRRRSDGCAEWCGRLGCVPVRLAAAAGLRSTCAEPIAVVVAHLKWPPVVAVSQSTRRHNPPTAPAPRTPRARARRCSQGGRLGRTRSGPSQTWHLPGTHRALPRRPFKQPYPAGAPPSSPTLAYRVRAQSGGATDAATSQTWARRNCNSPPPFASVPSATISAPFFTAVQRSHASAAGCAGQTNVL